MPVWECKKCGALISYMKRDKAPGKCSVCGSRKGKEADFKKDTKLGKGFEVKM